MNNLSTLAGVTHALPFHLYDDVKQQPTRCELVVHPAQGWAVATELENGTAGLSQCPVTLAAKVCQQFNIRGALCQRGAGFVRWSTVSGPAPGYAEARGS